MSGLEYKALREKVGTQHEAATLLGVSRPTIARREAPDGRITEEAAIAIRELASRSDTKGQNGEAEAALKKIRGMAEFWAAEAANNPWKEGDPETCESPHSAWHAKGVAEAFAQVGDTLFTLLPEPDSERSERRAND